MGNGHPQDLDLTTIDPTGLIGTRGYTLPDLDQLRVLSFEEAAQALPDMFTISGPVTANSGRVFLPADMTLLRPVEVILTRLARNATLVLDRDLTLAPRVRFMGRDQTAILSGGHPEVGHSGQINMHLTRANALIFWGAGSTSNGAQIVAADCGGGGGNACIIGDDCMFAGNIYVASSDQHALIDMDNGALINKAQQVVIEPHVWLGQASSVLKGVTIGLGTVVAKSAVVTRPVPRFSIVSGVPARVTRSNTSWDRKPMLRPETLDRLRAEAAAIPEFGDLRE